MPSGRWRWLRSQGLGLLCGFGTVLLLAVGSVVLSLTREGASQTVRLDDLSAFFTRPSPVHLWLYLLFPLAGLYAVNTTLATFDNLSRRWRAGQRAPAAYAAAVVHLGFLLGLLAHAVGGFCSTEHGATLLTAGWQPLPAFGEARLVSLEIESLPGGMPRSARAVVEVRRDGRLRRSEVGYNQPLSEGFGARLALLEDLGQVPLVRLASGPDRCALATGQGCLMGAEPVEVVEVSRAGASGAPAVLIRARQPDGALRERWLTADALLPLGGARPLELEGVEMGPAVVVRVRTTPGHPVAFAAAAVLTLGVLLMWRRLAGW
jgi:hypothetical protein